LLLVIGKTGNCHLVTGYW